MPGAPSTRMVMSAHEGEAWGGGQAWQSACAAKNKSRPGALRKQSKQWRLSSARQRINIWRVGHREIDRNNLERRGIKRPQPLSLSIIIPAINASSPKTRRAKFTAKRGLEGVDLRVSIKRLST